MGKSEIFIKQIKIFVQKIIKKIRKKLMKKLHKSLPAGFKHSARNRPISRLRVLSASLRRFENTSRTKLHNSNQLQFFSIIIAKGCKTDTLHAQRSSPL